MDTAYNGGDAKLTKVKIGFGPGNVPRNQNSVASLAGIGAYDDIEELGLNAQALSDLSPLADLPNLKWLDLSSSDMTCARLGTLPDLPNLEWLNLAHNDYTCGNLNDLPSLPKLERLDLLGHHVDDFAGLSNAPNLRHLILANEQGLIYGPDVSGSKLSTLPTLSMLDSLDLTWNSVDDDLSWLSKVPNLKLLDLRSNTIDGGEIEAMVGTIGGVNSTLEKLILANNDVGNFRWLNNQFTGLKHLSLHNNNIAQGDLADLTSNVPSTLQTLILTRNNLTSLISFPTDTQLPNLKVLELSGNRDGNTYITDVSPLASLSLETLVLGSLRVGVSTLPSSGNLFDNLERLVLYVNQISSLTGFPSFPKLKHLDLEDNDIGEAPGVNPLVSLSNLSLEELKLSGNDFTTGTLSDPRTPDPRLQTDITTMKGRGVVVECDETYCD